MGAEISWLLPAALIGLAAGLWFTRHTPRTDRVRAGLLLWGGWLVLTGAVFSFMSGIVHPYYTVALAPAIAALVAISVRELWRGKDFLLSRLVLAAMAAATGIWAFILLDRTPDWLPALRWIVLAGAVVTASVLAVGAHRLGHATAVLAIGALLFGAGGDGRIHDRDRRARTRRSHGQFRPEREQFGGRRASGTGWHAAVPVAPRPITPNSRLSSNPPTTAGPQPVSDPSPRAVWSSRPGHPSWRSVASPAQTTHRRWRNSSSMSPATRSATSLPATGVARAVSRAPAHDITTWVQQNFTPIDVGGDNRVRPERTGGEVMAEHVQPQSVTTTTRGTNVMKMKQSSPEPPSPADLSAAGLGLGAGLAYADPPSAGPGPVFVAAAADSVAGPRRLRPRQPRPPAVPIPRSLGTPGLRPGLSGLGILARSHLDSAVSLPTRRSPCPPYGKATVADLIRLILSRGIAAGVVIVEFAACVCSNRGGPNVRDRRVPGQQ